MLRGARASLLATALVLAAPSVASAVDVNGQAVNADGTVTAWTTTERLVPADTDSATDVYERVGGVTRLVSIGTAGGNGNVPVIYRGMDPDGRTHVFSTAERLVAADTDSVSDLYARYRSPTGTFTTEILSDRVAGPDSAQTPLFNAIINRPTTQRDSVVFTTAEAVTTDDTDTANDVYLRGASTTRESRTAAFAGNNDAFPATFEGISDGINDVVFSTREALTGSDGDTARDGYSFELGLLTDREAAGLDQDDDVTVHAVTVGSQRVVFESAEAITSDDDAGTDLFDYDFGADDTRLLTPGTTSLTNPPAFKFTAPVSDITYFESIEAIGPGDDDSARDVYRTTGTGTPARVSSGTGNADGNHEADDFASSFEGASADGDKAMFTATESFSGGDTDTRTDVYVKDASSGSTELASGVTFGDIYNVGAERIAADGSRVIWSTLETVPALGDSDLSRDLFRRELGISTNVITVTAFGGNGAFNTSFTDASENADAVAYETDERLVPQDIDADSDLYLRKNGTTTLESIEAIPPVTAIPGGPSLTRDSTPTFALGSNEPGSTFQCKVDGGAFAACGASFTTAALADGQHTVQVRATDVAGNTDPTPASRTFTVDTKAPETAFAGSSITRDSTPTLKLTSTETGGSFQCRFATTGAFGGCTSGKTLPDGRHTVQGRALDAAGNVDATPAQRTITVDTTKPKVAITRTAKRRGKRVRVTLRCRDKTTCKGRLTLRRGKKKAGSRAYTIRAGKQKTVSVTVKRRSRTLKATATVTDAAGNKGKAARKTLRVR